MKKFRVDIIFTDKKTFEQRSFEMDFEDRYDAELYRDEVLSNIDPNEYCHWNKVYPVITCSCGEEVECSNFTNTCYNCDSDYNFNGELLACREQWGEETGEDWSECY